MNVLVIGLGSMGRRRARLLKRISHDYNIIGVDSREDRCKQAQDELGISTSTSLELALKSCDPECAIISTSPLSHASIIKACLENGCHVFTELNLTKEGYADNTKLARELGKTLFISSTFLYRDEIKYINDAVSVSCIPTNYSYHVGQYLPDWHPWEAVSDYFISNPKTNGCRELFAIELPWLQKVFGDIASISVISGKNSSLPIQYKDNYMLLLSHAGGNKGTLSVDVISRKPVRNLEIYNENLYIAWNGSPTGLTRYDYNLKKDVNIDLYSEVDKQDGYASFVIENAYQNELVTFFETIAGKVQPEYTFEDDIKTLDLIDKIERMQ